MYDYRNNYQIIGGRLTRGVKYLLIITTIIYLLQLILRYYDISSLLILIFGLTPSIVIQNLYLHQIFTYMFLHSPSDPTHLLFNMLGLWMFGSPLEEKWGTRIFLKFYFICGIVGGIAVVLSGILFTSAYNVPTIGQSGAVFGLLGAFCTINPESRILFYFIIPIKAMQMLWIILFISILYALAGSPYSFPAHIGGLICSILIIKKLYIPSVMISVLREFIRRLRQKRLRVIEKDRFIN
ncbi:MAG: rhomboid family intramembrane serine protease [Deltaproteobacteria bacterium]|nr:rhomboid family intramembrane serine protease [Deltaproteobacteria bacterium]